MARVVKGEKRGARYAGKWLVDYRDVAGVRHLPSFETKAAAEDFLAKTALPAAHRDRTISQADRKTTLQQCFDRWLSITKTRGCKQRSLDIYQEQWTRYCSELATVEARTMTARRIEGLLLRLADRLGPSVLQLVHRVLHGTCGQAVKLGLLATNPAEGLSKELGLSRKRGTKVEEIKALDVEQAAKSLATVPPKLFAIFHLLIETGLRLGELLALEWPDLHLDARTLTVSKTMTCQDMAIGSPKTGVTRTVDLSTDVVVTLKAHALASGRREGFVFLPEKARGTVRHLIEKAMVKALQQAKLPVHFSPHCLRHTYASLMLSVVEAPITYVQRQLGHNNIQQTVNCYGSWIPHAKRYVDGLKLQRQQTATKTA